MGKNISVDSLGRVILAESDLQDLALAFVPSAGGVTSNASCTSSVVPNYVCKNTENCSGSLNQTCLNTSCKVRTEYGAEDSSAALN